MLRPRSALVLIVCCVFDFEKISRWTHGFSKHEHTHTAHTHRATYGGVAVCGVCACGVWTCEGSACDVLTSCFRAESPRSATGIALSGSCSTKFLLLFFELCFRSAQVGGKAPDTRRKIEFDEFLSREVVKRKGVSFAAAVGTSSRAILKKAVTFLRQKRRTGRTFCSLHLLCGV